MANVAAHQTGMTTRANMSRPASHRGTGAYRLCIERVIRVTPPSFSTATGRAAALGSYCNSTTIPPFSGPNQKNASQSKVVPRTNSYSELDSSDGIAIAITSHVCRHGGGGENWSRQAGSYTMQMEDLRDLYVDQLRDLFNAENQLIKALPKMAKAASNEQLSQSFLDHLEETKGHAERLKEIFSELGEKPTGKVCKAMEGLIEEGKETMEEDAEPEVMDAGLIAAAQRVEHYEMAGYGTVRSFAKLLGETQAAKLLQQTLDEEGACDKKLSKLAESTINLEASKMA
jgi:ferritin-like metal-binding protein YciE